MQATEPLFLPKNKLRWLLGSLLFVAIFADFLANEKPLCCQIDGRLYFPILRTNVRPQPCQWQLLPLIPYSPTTMDATNQLKSPFELQSVASLRHRHWLGTDHLGRDTAAGMIFGTRIALQVGCLGMALAAFIGIFLGAISGFFGDSGLKTTRLSTALHVLGVALAWLYGFSLRQYEWSEATHLLPELLKSTLIFCLILALTNLFSFSLQKILQKIMAFKSKEIAIPADLLIMRAVEILNAVPRLLLILCLTAVVAKPSIAYIVVFVGLTYWTGITKFLRAELLRLRNLPYIEAARALGISEWQILWRHALPNALGSVWVTLPFGIAGAIMTEASLSFLGIGLPAEAVTWGSMLSLAREHTGAWWLALLPGIAIFTVVFALHQYSETE